MLRLVQESLTAQFHASLSMLNDCIASCPDQQWREDVGNFPFWQVGYHILFYADFYLSPSDSAYQPPDFHRVDHASFEKKASASDDVFDRALLLGYLRHCREKATEVIAAETVESLAGPSGFSWYRIPRIEFHVNNIRHIQHHAAQMSLFLRKSAGIEIGWVGSGFRETSPRSHD